MKTGTLLAIVVFTIVALAHLYRLLSGTEVSINGDLMPQWISVPGVLIPGLIAWVLRKESK
jgi:Na+/H+ antiporter NhaA